MNLMIYIKICLVFCSIINKNIKKYMIKSK